MSAASELGLQWVRNADEQRTLAELALDLQVAFDTALPAVLRARLTDGGTKARYPGGRNYSEAEAREAVSAATSARAVLAALRPGLASPTP